jgi:predicted permease
MLLAARNTARRREFSIRLALGSSRGRLFRQLLAESLVLVASGALLGWLFALGATRALARWSDIEASLSPDARVLLFTLAISLVAGLVFGLAPLVRMAKVSVGDVLKTSAATAFRDTSKVRMGRVTAALQVSLCLVLLAGTVLLVRTLRNLESVNLGFRSTGLLVFGVNPRVQAHSDESTLAFYRSLLNKLRSLPEVEAATLMQNRIGSGWSNNTGAVLDGKNPHPGQNSPMRWNGVGPDYFRTLGIPILYGREFDEGDGAKSAKVAVVNSTFGKKYLNGRQAIGHTVSFSSKTPFTIVGIVPDSKYTQVREEPIPMAYFPYTQLEGLGAMHVELRTHGNPKLLIPRVQRILLSFAPDLAPLQPMTQTEQFDASISGDRLIARLAMFFGLLAVTLVASGLYGTVAYNVSRRTSELGIRMALGAERRQVLWMVLREGLQLCILGILVGLPITFAATRLLSSLLYGLKPYDPLSICAATAGIVAVTAIACVIPAQRAASINPALALRNE